MKAGFKDFFGSNLEQEVIDQIIFLPHANRNGVANGVINTPTGVEWSDLEFLEIGMGISTNTILYESITVDKLKIAAQPTGWRAELNFVNESGAIWRMTVHATSATTATWVGVSSASEFCWPQYMVGYKRRMSRVGIDELMLAMSLPNLIANCDLTDNPINQRGFDGNWTALAVGDYGYDGWMKVSSTHMGAVIEAGKYRPNAKHTLTKDDVVIGEFMSPASGHWSVAVPFATSGKFDLYAGQFKRPWHPVLDGLRRCQRYYQFIGYIKINGGYIISAGQGLSETHKINEVMRVMPKTSFEMEANLNISSATIDPSLATQGYIQVNPTQSAYAAGYRVYLKDVVLDASIALAELNGQIITV